MVCRSVTPLTSAKTAEAIKMLAVCVEDSVGPKEPYITYSGAHQAEYCIVDIPHNTAI